MNLKTLLLISFAVPSLAVANLTEEQKNQVKKEVEGYIKENPHVIVTALQTHAKNEEDKHTAAMNQKIKASKEDLLNQSTACVVGNPKAETKLIVFYDNNCSHCRTIEQLLKKYQSKNQNTAIYYRQFPILGEPSKDAASMMIALNHLGKFEPVADAIAQSKELMNKENLLKLAKNSGVEEAELNRHLQSTDTAKILKQNLDLAKKLELEGTPVVISAKGDDIKLLSGADLSTFLNIKDESES